VTGSWRFGAKTDVGLVRDGNEDSLYAGPRLLVVADGVGGSVAGEIASKLAVQTLAPLDSDGTISDPLAALREAVLRADAQLRDAIASDPRLSGMGTTLTAILGAGDTVGLAQLGDSRAYLFRSGELSQITRDHTLVQSLVDEGQITAEEAQVHPRRSWILRALDGRGEAEPDLMPLTAVAGDRYLLCSDGLSDYVDQGAIEAALAAGDDPQPTCERLVELALHAGAPDNVTCIVAEPVEGDEPAPKPVIAGAAATPDRTRTVEAQPAAAVQRSADGPRRRGGIGRRLAIVAVIVILLVAAAIGGTALYIRGQWYVADHDGYVGVFHGVRGSFASVSLSRLDTQTALPIDQVTEADRALLTSGQVSSRSDVNAEIKTLTTDACDAWTAAHPAKPAPKKHKHTVARQPVQPTPPTWCASAP
jgi:protein phosphatase